MTNYDLFRFIQENQLAVLSTVSAKGTPQAALVGIAVTTDLEIIFDTVTTSRKCRNLKANPAVAFVIGCTGEKTLQYEGFAQELAGGELEKYRAIYFSIWPDGKSRESWPGICHFVVKPRWIRFSDYEITTGATSALIEEINFTSQEEPKGL